MCAELSKDGAYYYPNDVLLKIKLIVHKYDHALRLQ